MPLNRKAQRRRGSSLDEIHLARDAPSARPRGRVTIWRLNGRGWRRVRELAKPIGVADVRAVARRADELVEFVPESGRGSPMVVAGPALLDAWMERSPAR